MPVVYLEPGDLSAPQVQRVLDFLNRAGSAQQLGRDIEFPDEPDIGIKLGQRLLDARAALGGAFTDIAQVRAVRLIGPERFTEICVAALGLEPRRWVELFYGGAPLAPQTESGLVLSLEMRPQPAWLGQPLNLTVRVSDKGGGARLGVPVTLHTGIGRLVAMFGFNRIEGEAVTVLTGADGSADLELVVDASEPLSEIQQSALENALYALDPLAPDPAKLSDAFAAMVESYLQERSYNLRRAVDLWVRDQRDAMIDSINRTRWAFSWPVRSALVQADVLAGDGGGSSLARAVATARWTNWVGAWLLAMDEHLRRSGKLDETLNPRGTGADGRLLGELLGSAQRFVAAQPGLSAELLGRKQVQAAVSRLVSSDLTRLDAEAQADLLTQLETAAVDVRPTSLGSYTLVTKVRKNLIGRIGDIGQIGALNLQRMEALASQIDERASAIGVLAAQVERQSVQVDATAEALRRDRSQVDQQLAAFNLQRSELSEQIDQFSRLATQFQQTSATVTRQVAQFDSQLAAFQRDRATIDSRIDGLNTDLATVKRRVDRFVLRPAPRVRAAKSAPKPGPGKKP